MDLFTIGTDDRRTFLSGQLRQGILVLANSWGGSARLEFPHVRLDQEGRWYHLAIVHTRGRFRRLQGGGSEMKVYLDGFAKGTAKVHYNSNSGVNVGAWLGLWAGGDRADFRVSKSSANLDTVWRLGIMALISSTLY